MYYQLIVKSTHSQSVYQKHIHGILEIMKDSREYFFGKQRVVSDKVDHNYLILNRD